MCHVSRILMSAPISVRYRKTILPHLAAKCSGVPPLLLPLLSEHLFRRELSLLPVYHTMLKNVVALNQ